MQVEDLMAIQRFRRGATSDYGTQPRFSEIVADSLLHFDGVRYRRGDFVVMSNTVHLQAAFADEDQIRMQF